MNDIVDFYGLRVDLSKAFLSTVISEKTNVCLDFQCTEGVLVQGNVLGNISSLSGYTMVTETSTIKGFIACEKLIVAGVVYGDVYANSEVILLGAAEIHGNIYCPGFITSSEDCYIGGRIIKAARTIEHFTQYKQQVS